MGLRAVQMRRYGGRQACWVDAIENPANLAAFIGPSFCLDQSVVIATPYKITTKNNTYLAGGPYSPTLETLDPQAKLQNNG
jgi:hypothetical protein